MSANITLTGRIAFSMDRAEARYRIPVLVIDGDAYGSADEYGPALRGALDDPADDLNWLNGVYSGYQLLLDLCRQHGAMAMDSLNAWSPVAWGMPNGEVA